MVENADLQAFPAFTDLKIKSLLYYQAQLADSRARLHQLEWGGRGYRNGEFEFLATFVRGKLYFPLRRSRARGGDVIGASN
jgi:hypothetical protein